jgi:elongation factor Ts
MSHPHRVIESYVHGGRIGVLLEIGLDTSFTAGLPEFKQLAKDLALQVAAVPVGTIEELLAQVYVKDNALTVAQILGNASRQLGERIAVTRFVRWDTEAPQPSEPPRTPAVAARAGKVA